jgi:hypothetical protein
MLCEEFSENILYAGSVIFVDQIVMPEKNKQDTSTGTGFWCNFT